MKVYWGKLEIFHKSIIVSIPYSIISIIISLILLLDSISWLYGALLGISLFYLSYLFIWILWYKIKSIKTLMAKTIPLLVPILRILIFITIYLVVILVINKGTGLEKFLEPINTFALLATYSISLLSFGTVCFIEMIIN